ncbi:hypothetical protein, partial [Pseudomonas syringae group genomosp. 7]|uniref:hypothetical protein n=1 Tax=Pseudomonas syringae group genomosp. 7 TaxID=251699 RepID=UPI003770725C
GGWVVVGWCFGCWMGCGCRFVLACVCVWACWVWCVGCVVVCCGGCGGVVWVFVGWLVVFVGVVVLGLVGVVGVGVFVLTRNFVEGADVKGGAVLFQIDPEPF